MKRMILVVCLMSVMTVVNPFVSRADDASSGSTSTPDWKKLYEEQKQRNDALERRMSILEEKDKAEPYVTKESVPEATMGFLKQTEISGFVSASFTHNFNKPADDLNNGRLYDSQHDEFMFNKFVLILQNPVDYNAFDWDAGFFVELLFGQDALSTRSKSPDTAAGLFNLGDNGDVEQAYLQVNVPVGNGLKVMFGKYVTPMGYELVENEQNPNWSGGYQWTFIEPFTHTGVQFAYPITDKLEANILINQGWDTVKDNNQSKSFMGRLAYTPNDKMSYTLIAYGGPEQSDALNDPVNAVPHANANWRKGVELVVTHKCTPKLNTAVQVDYGDEDGGSPSGDYAQWYAFGTWGTYDFTEKVQGACRLDFLSDRQGGRTSGFLFPANTGQDLWSLTLTVNIKPVENLRLAPELRYDHSSLSTAFDAHRDQVTAAFGAVYSY